MDRDADPLPLPLSLVKEAKSRREEGDRRGGTVDIRCQDCRGARLVMVFQEAGHAVLILLRASQMFADRARQAVHQAVVEFLVVGVIEALLLESPLHIPVNLGQKEETRELRMDALRGPRPEMIGGNVPGPLEDLRDNQHGHVTADAITLARDPPQLAEHGLLQIRIAIVQLQRIRPACKVGIAPIGQDSTFAGDLPAAEILRLGGELFLGAGDEEVRVLLHPGMIRRDMVGDKVQDQPQIATAHPLSQSCKRFVPSEILVNMIVMDRKTGAADIGILKIGQSTLVFGAHPSKRS